MNINDIQFPEFEFAGIDAEIKKQQGYYKRKETRNHCCSDESYEVEVDSYGDVYDIDLRETAELIKQKIDEQVKKNQNLLERVIDKQVSGDFKSAEQQINDYIKKFQHEFDCLLKERETRESEKMEIRATLEAEKVKLNEFLNELAPVRASLNNWKPQQIPIMLG
ncbi:hypothetical protein NIES4071_71050 [Calothrix sp. NIES-4071]|nr:hypothetical protein NIES4071_71050 [Calothrix sp. NIES-4071]BAZ61380.1 hypothetical protein NIES4105_71000 [Calothrix sp. NIES-4105]